MSVKLVTVFLKWLLEMRAVGMMDFSFFLTFPLLPPPFIIFYVQTENYTIGSFGSQVFRLELIVLTKYMTETTWERKGLFSSRFHMVYSIMVGTRVGWSNSHHGGPVGGKGVFWIHLAFSFLLSLYAYPIGWLHSTFRAILLLSKPSLSIPSMPIP